MGRGPDGRIKRQRNIPNYKKGGYSASLFARIQVPSVDGRLSAKRFRYHKRLALSQQVENEMLGHAEMEEVPSFETLLTSLLSRLIHFSVIKCGYSGTRYELIAN